jgi:mannitol 2-dehydrogenase
MQVEQPVYSHTDVSVGIVHFGVGNFHRSHQAMYLDRLFSKGLARTWGICGVGVMAGDIRMRDALESQGLRYTLVERHGDGSATAHSIGSIVEYLFAPEDPEAVLVRLSCPATRIVSLTITEGGYNICDGTGEFKGENPAIVKDLEPGALPTTVFAFVVEALRRRREHGIPPFTIMSCDNLENNGAIARKAFIGFAKLRDPALAEWMEQEVAFPNSMVDRITPVTSDEDRQFVKDTFEIVDAWPVICEPFTQWVLEDHFTMGRPPLEEVGVQVVSDVAPYERMKLRLLNASHQAIAYFGSLLGYEYAHEAAADPVIARLLRAFMDTEAEPTLELVPGIDLPEYKRTLMRRFTNSHIRDTLARLATDAADRIAKFVLPIIKDQLDAGRSVCVSAAIIASWAVFAEQGDNVHVRARDRQQPLIDAALERQKIDPIGFVHDATLFGTLGTQTPFTGHFQHIYQEIRTHGARHAYETLLSEHVAHEGCSSISF